MGEYDMFVVLGICILGFVVFYFFASSGLLGNGLQDAFGGVNTALGTIGSGLGIVGGSQQLGEKCEKGKLACDAGLVCVDGKCTPDTARVGERCTPGKKTVTVSGIIGGNAFQDKGGIECESGAHCINNVCYPDPTEIGDKCYPDKLKCPDGMKCYPRTGWGKCYEHPASENQVCIRGGYIECGEDLTCVTPGNISTSGTKGKCVSNRNQVEGGVCKSSGANTVECGKGLVCVDSKCVKDPSGEGDYCKPGTKAECPNGHTCWPRDGTGKCYKNSGQTLGGVCITKSGPSENRIECGPGLACLPRGVGKCVPEVANKGDECISDHVKCSGSLICKNKDSRGVGRCE